MAGSYILCNKLHNNGLMTDWELCESLVEYMRISLYKSTKNGHSWEKNDR